MVFRRGAALLFVFALLLSPFSPPAAGAQGSSQPVPQLRTLANGMRIVVLEDHAAPVVQVTTWYRFGALEETPGKTGLAHALEHMMFRGTPTLSAAGLDNMNARLGAEVNAQTQNEDTHFYFVVPSDRVETVMRVESDRMRNLKLAPEDWNIERGAVLNEYAGDFSNPVYGFVFGTAQRVFPGSRLGETALGSRSDIEHATVADLRKYYDEWYHPNNATMVITGDVKADDVFAYAERWFGPIPAKQLPARKQYAVHPAHGVTWHSEQPFPYTIIDEAYAAPGDAPATEYHQLRNDIAIDALFNPRGPFRKALVESGLVLAYEPQPIEDRRASIVHILLYVAPNHTVAEVRAAYEKTMRNVLAHGIDRELILASQREMIASLSYARDSIVGLGDAIGGAYVYPGDTDPMKYAGIFAQVTPDEVNREARAIYAKANVVGVLEPTTRATKAAGGGAVTASVSDNFGSRIPNGPIVQPDWLRADLNKPLALRSEVAPVVTTLPNGLHLLVQRVTTNPTVFVRGVVQLSPQFDPAGKEGVGDVTSQLMEWGSAKYSYDQAHRIADDDAAQIDLGTSFGAHGRAGDVNTFLDVIADDLRAPTFPQDKFELVKSQTHDVLAKREQQAGYLAETLLARALYPADDPALRRQTPYSIDAITLDDVRTFHKIYVRPDTTTLVVVGDVDPAAVAKAVEDRFGDWTVEGSKPDVHLPQIPLPRPIRQNVDTSSQSVGVELASPSLARTSPDYEALELANAILGGGTFGSRLFDEVREKRGLVYGAYSNLHANRDRGTFEVDFQAVPEKVDAADALVRDEIRRMQTEDVTAEELQSAKTRVVAEQVDAEQATSTIASDLLQIGVNGLPDTYYATLADRYANITPADVRRAATEGMHPDALIEVRVGPRPAP
jgi:zinc protease